LTIKSLQQPAEATVSQQCQSKHETQVICVTAAAAAAGEVAPLECNLDALSGISYTKGCYIGQERNSYTHYRGIIRRRLMPVRLQGLNDSTSESHG
jgi:folate-binding protein YgfZ